MQLCALTLLLASATGLQLQLHGAPARPAVARHAVPCMKGKGSRGMPGKAMKGPPSGGTGVKKRMQKQDFQQRKEWVQVLNNVTELGDSLGASKAVQAGVTPTGQDFIWCLIRGKEVDENGNPEVFAVDGACRCCQFPLLNANIDDDATKLTCGLCGTSWSLEKGDCIEHLPASNPVQWAAKKANEKKGVQRLGVLPTRVSKAGKVYLRLPDGTLTSRLA